MREAGPVIERLAEDYPPAVVLLESLAIADAAPAHLGTPRHLEQAEAQLLRDLES